MLIVVVAVSPLHVPNQVDLGFVIKEEASSYSGCGVNFPAM